MNGANAANDAAPALRLVPATVHGRTLVRAPGTAPPHHWFVGFHGYAHNAEIMFEMLCKVPRAGDWLVASVQALHPFYNRGDQVVANWMTRQDREQAIADNIAYVDAVIASLEREFGAPQSLVYAGFSQGVAMAYRAAVRGRRNGGAVLAVAGDVPPELLDGEPQRWPQVRMITGTKDEWYSPARMGRDAIALEMAGASVQSSAFEGGHEWTSDVDAAAGEWLAAIAGQARGL